MLEHAFGHDAAHLAAAEKRELLQRLVARLAHEIRNPLSSLDIHIQLLDEDLQGLTSTKGAPLRSRLSIIRGELGRLESVVEQFLRLGGPSQLEVEPVNVDAIVQHVCDLMHPEAANRGIELVQHVAADLPMVKADSVQLTQALLNLVINALQAVEKLGTVKIDVSAAEGWVRFQISDTGPGLPPAKLTAIFDPYYTTKAEGSGLGLWIAQQIVTAHGGTLEASNGTERGAVFVIRLAGEAAGGDRG